VPLRGAPMCRYARVLGRGIRHWVLPLGAHGDPVSAARTRREA